MARKWKLLNGLQDRNETLFYRLMMEHLAEMMPLIYTPVVAEACQRFSDIYRRPRGLFIAYPERDRIDEMLMSAVASLTLSAPAFTWLSHSG